MRISLGTENLKSRLLVATVYAAFAACSVAPDESQRQSERTLTIKDSTVRTDSLTADATPVDSNEESKSFELFKTTVYEVVKNCTSCHDTTTAPKFASADPLIAFTELTEGAKVNLKDPAASRIVSRLSEDLHNCWSDCQTDAQTMLAAVEKWSQALESDTDHAAFNYMSEGLTFAQAVAQANTNPLQKGILAYEMEDSILKAPFAAGEEDGLFFVTTTEGGGTSTSIADAAQNPALGSLSVAFEADENSAAWEVYVRVQAPDQNGNTVFFQMDDQPLEQWDIPPTGTNFVYRKIASTTTGDRRFQLFKGKHTLKLIQGDDHIKFDKIVITRVVIADIEQVQTTSMKSTVFYYDLSKHVGGLDIGISISIDDFDATAYLFRDFVFVNNSGREILIKGLYPVINGTYLPSHAAWSKAKVSTEEPVSEFASNSTTVLKHTSLETDSIQLGFDEITVVE